MPISRHTKRYGAALAGAIALSLAPQVANAAVQPPPAGTPPSQFATQDPGCLGPLRSMIASGQLAGVMLPDGFVIPSGFSGSFNPGDHFGTVQEAQFLESHGVADLTSFCALFGAS
ncbi:MAG TPA: hypothetical protein VH208_06910 [Myxococcaceae bacterium]|nr:hypothetical protein [Myxococcaceae bacterium]